MADGKVGEFLGHGVHQSIYKIEPGDRSGISKVQVFVDDQHITDLEFTIEPPKS